MLSEEERILETDTGGASGCYQRESKLLYHLLYLYTFIPASLRPTTIHFSFLLKPICFQLQHETLSYTDCAIGSNLQFNNVITVIRRLHLHITHLIKHII
jgi:hypothetical protein